MVMQGAHCPRCGLARASRPGLASSRVVRGQPNYGAYGRTGRGRRQRHNTIAVFSFERSPVRHVAGQQPCLCWPSPEPRTARRPAYRAPCAPHPWSKRPTSPCSSSVGRAMAPEKELRGLHHDCRRVAFGVEIPADRPGAEESRRLHLGESRRPSTGKRRGRCLEQRGRPGLLSEALPHRNARWLLRISELGSGPSSSRRQILRLDATQRGLADSFALEVGGGVFLVAGPVQSKRKGHLGARDEDWRSRHGRRARRRGAHRRWRRDRSPRARPTGMRARMDR